MLYKYKQCLVKSIINDCFLLQLYLNLLIKLIILGVKLEIKIICKVFLLIIFVKSLEL